MNVLFEPLRFTKNVESRKNLEKRLYHWISSSRKGNQEIRG